MAIVFLEQHSRKVQQQFALAVVHHRSVLVHQLKVVGGFFEVDLWLYVKLSERLVVGENGAGLGDRTVTQNRKTRQQTQQPQHNTQK